jgi:hypothetical protein
VRPLLSALLAIALSLLVPTPAWAATTVGSSLPEFSGDTLECLDAGGCTFVPTTIAGTPIAVPFDGVIVRWAGRVPAGAPSIDLRVLRPSLGGNLTGVGSLNSLTPLADSTISRGARMPVKAGDLIGLDLAVGEEIGIANHPAFDSSSFTFAPKLGTTETRAPTSMDSDDFEALFNAVLEPDADGDGWGDETQDRCPQLAELHTFCSGHVYIDSNPTLVGPVLAGRDFQASTSVVALSSHRVPNVILKLTLPSELGAGTLPAPCALEGNQVVCRLGDLAARQRVRVNVPLRALRVGTVRQWPSGPPFATIKAELTSGLHTAVPTITQWIRILATGRCSNRAFPGGFPGGTTFAGDRVTGSAETDRISGLAGDDCLTGEDGDDVLSGGDGNDRLNGGPGKDVTRGDAGGDRLVGGTGVDRLEGGPGPDFVDAVDGKRDIVRCGPGRDHARVDAIDSVSGCERVKR